MDVLLVFALYLVVVFVLAGLANRSARGKSFAGEYFLGSRNLGVWAFGLTYAATVASGGTFVGLPSLLYTHGWAAGWFICAYMVVPLVAMGLIAKRINHASRLCGAITIPELLRKRFGSDGVGGFSTAMVLFFLFFFLLAQFKAGAQIMATLLEGIPVYQLAVMGVERLVGGVPWVGDAEPGYLLCLIVFAAAVVVYTAYGGFRAVVWTDVMQGLVMLLGTLLMLGFVFVQLGGFGRVTEQLAEMTPPEFGEVVLHRAGSGKQEVRVPRGGWVSIGNGERVARLAAAGGIPAGTEAGEPVAVLLPTTPAEISRVRERLEAEPWHGEVVAELEGAVRGYAAGAGERGAYVSAPGPSATNPAGFLPLALAFSFFIFWNFGLVGNPAFMVRQMAYRSTAVLRRAMILVAVYFALIYFPLVLIFTAARILLPGMEVDPDRVMPETAAILTANAGVPWLAGFLVAAPFAAVMSSVDSFLLMVSSAVVRDVYQQKINPRASEARLRTLSHAVTLLVGLLALLAVLHPPLFLQDLIIFASAGLGACFLAPIVMALYWPRMTGAGAVAGMLGGCGAVLALYSVGYIQNNRFGDYYLLGLHPFIWAAAVSFFFVVAVSLLGRRPSEDIRRTFFGDGGGARRSNP